MHPHTFSANLGSLSMTMDPLQGLEGVWGRWLGGGGVGWGGASDDCVSGVQCDVRCQVICLPARVYFWGTGIAL